MSECYLGEIRMFGGNFAPRQWSYCDGQLIAISQNDALFSLLSTIYGGDGRSTFGLPDLRGRVPMHFGQGPGLTSRSQGQKFGDEYVILDDNHIPSHTHQMFSAPDTTGNSADPTAKATAGGQMVYADVAAATAGTLAAESVANTGVGTQHSNMMPYQAVHFIIALAGQYPSRN